eukprot:TRINITY_DN1497_c0_g1_i1.p1 TRINITY_DN1497_c0_g1~~TRINITY_DN1497_c0_g1_i1.p1  ORF type:complete len:336 (+),score=96.94 TRINITY_DN1497_c0_g1_i1:140-1009(+)
MGSRISVKLGDLNGIDKIHVWDRTPSVVESHSSEFGTKGNSLSDFKNVQYLFMCLPTSVEVEEVVDKTLDYLEPGTIIVDLTSGMPTHTRKIAKKCEEKKIDFVDCPVSGGPDGAASGTLCAMVGGSEQSFKKVEPFIGTFAKKIVHVGDVGSGHAVKCINNVLNTTHMLAVTEGLLALQKFGVDPEVALAAINDSSGRSLMTEVRIPKEVLTGDFNYGFRLGLMKKDVRIADSLMAECFPEGKVLRVAKGVMDDAVDEFGENVDYTDACRLLEERAGHELRTEKNTEN